MSVLEYSLASPVVMPHGLFIANRRRRILQDETSDMVNGVRTNAMSLILEEGQAQSPCWLCLQGYALSAQRNAWRSCSFCAYRAVDDYKKSLQHARCSILRHAFR